MLLSHRHRPIVFGACPRTFLASFTLLTVIVWAKSKGRGVVGGKRSLQAPKPNVVGRGAPTGSHRVGDTSSKRESKNQLPKTSQPHYTIGNVIYHFHIKYTQSISLQKLHCTLHCTPKATTPNSTCCECVRLIIDYHNRWQGSWVRSAGWDCCTPHSPVHY